MKPQAPGQFALRVGPPNEAALAGLLAEYAQGLGRPADAAEPGSRSRLGSPRRQLWLAPTRGVAADRREALVDLAGAALDPGVTTFAGMAAEVLRDAGLLLAPITRLQRQRLLGRLIETAAAAGRLEHYAALADRPGLVGIVDEQIADLQRSGQTPADCRRQAEAEGDARLRDLALVFARYAERLERSGLIDAQSLLTTAAATLATSPPDRGPVAGPFELVVVEGFATFTTIELRLLAQIAAHSRRVIVTLPGDAPGGDRDALFALPLAAATSLRSDLGATLEPIAPPAEAGWPALAHIERNLFRNLRDLDPPAPAVAASLERIHIVAASGVQAEIVEIARRVKRLLADGAAPQDIVVAFRSTRDVADRVRQVFDDYGIPASIDAPRSLSSTPLVRTLHNVLRLAADDWPYRRVLRLAGDRTLRRLDVHATASGATSALDARRASENCVRYAQLPSGRLALLAQLQAWADDADRTAEPTPADAALALTAFESVGNILRLLPRSATIAEWIAKLGPLANDLGLLRPAVGDTPANWAILVRALRAAERIDAAAGHAAQELSLGEFLEVFTMIAAQAPAASTGDAVGRVRVLGAEAARHTRPQHLLVGGLSEQAFPHPPRGVLAGGAAHDAAAARSAEMLLFYQLLTRPTATLTLSFPALDERAQTLPASPFLAELERTFGELEIPRTVQALNYGSAAEPGGAAPLARSELRRQAVAQALGGQRELLSALCTAGGAGVGDAVVAGIDAVAQRGRRDAFGPFDGLVQSPAAAAKLAAAYGPHAVWSPSGLEKYAACPFLFFGEQLLKLRPTPELALESDLARRGSVLHAALAHLYGELRAAATAADEVAAELVGLFHAALDAVAAARPGRGVDAAIREIERRQIAAWAEAFARQHAEYRRHWSQLDEPPTPAHFEVRFGPRSKHSDTRGDAALSTETPFALEVTVDGLRETVQFAGQIDRIDLGRVGDRLVFNIVDYKTTARAAVRPEAIHAGKQIQLPLYALAVEQHLLADQDAAALSAGYWSVRGDGFRLKARSGGPLAIHEVKNGGLAPAPTWAETRDRLVARIGEIVAAIRRGEFPVYNDDPQCTAHCNLRTICRIAQVRSLEKQWPPAVVAKKT
jgi:ATP-dependent helicase/DNAse subunit B